MNFFESTKPVGSKQDSEDIRIEYSKRYAEGAYSLNFVVIHFYWSTAITFVGLNTTVYLSCGGPRGLRIFSYTIGMDTIS